MRTIDRLLSEYGESHQNGVNKLIHWVCVPAIMFSLLGLIMSIPFINERTLFLNWASLFFYLTLLYYLRLSFPMFVGFIFIGGLMILGNFSLFEAVSKNGLQLTWISLSIFVISLHQNSCNKI